MFPGGRRMSRESLQDCLAREIAEELPGLAFAGCRIWRKLKGRNPYSGRKMSDAIFVGTRAAGGLMLGDPAELDQVAWRRPWNLALTPTTRAIRDTLVRDGMLRTR
jgi:8-oxo-dGTP pyrophosphatase MutT (NUDIX family)